MPDDSGSIWPSIIGLLGGAFQTYGAISQSSSYNQAIRAAQEREKQLYDRYSKTTPAQDMEGIMQLKQGLNDKVRNAIIQEITAQMSARGLTGSSGIVQEAIAEALAKAELPLFQIAVDSYYKRQQLPIAALPRTLPAAPQGLKSNPFQSLVDIATNKKLLTGLFNPEKPTTPTPWEVGNTEVPIIPQAPAPEEAAGP